MQCDISWLGLIDYDKCYKLQLKLWRARLDEEIPDTILLLEHPPVITLGQSGNQQNILVSREELAQKGISMFFSDRGGDVTYHGPGQLVAYPIFDLRKRNRDLHQFVYDLEEVILRTLRDFKINGQRDENHPGIWVQQAEIAALGLRIRNWVTMHGLALNVNTDLEHFSLINPCGFSDRKATSMSKLLSGKVPIEEVKIKMLTHFSEVFDMQIVHQPNILIREHLQ
jgi:lipoyl(octanoyl) transferase